MYNLMSFVQKNVSTLLFYILATHYKYVANVLQNVANTFEHMCNALFPIIMKSIMNSSSMMSVILKNINQVIFCSNIIGNILNSNLGQDCFSTKYGWFGCCYAAML